MGLFKDLGCLIGEIAEATGECADELICTAAGAVTDELTRPRSRRVVRKTTIVEDDYYRPRVRKVTVIEEEEPDVIGVLFGNRYGRRW